MTTSLCMLAFAIALGAAPAKDAPRATVVVRATGFGDDDVARLEQKANAEVAATGVEVWALSSALAVKPECLGDRACAKEVLRAASASLLVRVDLTRGGGNVQIAVALLDDEGRIVADASAAARVAAALGAEPILPEAVASALRAAVRERASASEPKPPGDTKPPPPKDAPPPVDDKPPPHDEPPAVDEERPLSGLALAGIGGIAAGAVMTMVGAAGAAGQYGVARDPQAAGADKERAAVLVPTLGAVAAGGVVVAALGGWLLWSELSP